MVQLLLEIFGSCKEITVNLQPEFKLICHGLIGKFAKTKYYC